MPSPLEPMEARVVAALPRGKVWRYEPKWDGFRCLAFKQGGDIVLQSKSGKPLTRYFPDVVECLRPLRASTFILDGELLIRSGETFSFSDLQLRLHPAESRVRKLSAQSPATYMLFDILKDGEGKAFLNVPFALRRAALERFHAQFAEDAPCIRLSPQTSSLTKAQTWMRTMAGQIDGVVAKDSADVYAPGERLMQKYKFVRTADCVVGGFRYGDGSRLIGSLLLGLYDGEGRLHHVGFTSGIAKAEKPALTKKSGEADRVARLHRSGPWRTEPLEHGTVRRVEAPQAGIGGGSVLRSCYGQSLPAWNSIVALAAR